MDLTEATNTRRSVRAFLDRPVDPALLRQLLQQAARAPSGGNLQPWHVHVVTGDRLALLKSRMQVLAAKSPAGEEMEYDIYPAALAAPYRERRFAIGEAMYALLDIPRADRAARRTWFARNFQLFGASVGLFCTVDRTMGPPQWSDLGMFLQTLMLLLCEAGLASCAQESWALYPSTLAAFLKFPEHHMLFCGVAIGWADHEAAVNKLASPRAALEEFATFHT